MKNQRKSKEGLMLLTSGFWNTSEKVFPTLLVSTLSFCFFLKTIYLHFWRWWVLVAVCGLSLVAVSGGYSSLWYATLCWLPFLQSTDSRVHELQEVQCVDSLVMAMGLVALWHMESSQIRIELYSLRWQACFKPLYHQRNSPSPALNLAFLICTTFSPFT